MPRPRSTIPPAAAPQLGPADDDLSLDRDRFGRHELAIVLSHYSLGEIRSIREFRRGSRRSPKVRITSSRGLFLLKRRAPGRDEPHRVLFAHDVQSYLRGCGYPVPALIPTVRTGSAMIEHQGKVYELFEFIDGTRDDGSRDAAREAGRTLGRLHSLVRRYPNSHNGVAASYHRAAGIDDALAQIPASIRAVESGADEGDLQQTCIRLRDSYARAAATADRLGADRWPIGILHGDWHPGNLLFVDGSIRAVLDFDSIRTSPFVLDLANAALQFSMRMGDPNDPDTWPAEPDLSRLRSLMAGYDEAAGEARSAEERQALPWLVMEALILESVVPIAAAGRFAHLSGSSFLRMVDRKVRWLALRGASLSDLPDQKGPPSE